MTRRKADMTRNGSPALFVGAVALTGAGLLWWIDPSLAVYPLATFLLLCFAAPFFPCCGFFLPVVCRGRAGGVALSFDDGPHPDSTPLILDLLDRYGLQATFFVIGRQAEQHPQLIDEIIRRGHTIGNHSLRHDSLLMLRSGRTLLEDIQATQLILQRRGIRPRLFRPPAGITNPRLARVLAELDLAAVNASCRALDFGNRRIERLAEIILSRVKEGDIIMLHDLPAHDPARAGHLQEQLEQVLAALASRYPVRPLEELVGFPVMEKVAASPRSAR